MIYFEHFQTTDTKASSIFKPGDIILSPMHFHHNGSFRADTAGIFKPTERNYKCRILLGYSFLPTPHLAPSIGIVAFADLRPQSHDLFVKVKWVRENCVGVMPVMSQEQEECTVPFERWALHMMDSRNDLPHQFAGAAEDQHHYFKYLAGKPSGLLCITRRPDHGTGYLVSRYGVSPP